MAVVDSVAVFVVSLLVGTVAIVVGARLVVDEDAGLLNASFTALVGALAWAVSSLLFGWIPLLGVLLTLLIWIAVVNWRYPGGWASAAAIGFVAWIAAVGIVYLAAVLGLVTPDVLGIPGV